MEGSNIGFIPPNSQNNSSDPATTVCSQLSVRLLPPDAWKEHCVSQDTCVNVICISISCGGNIGTDGWKMRLRAQLDNPLTMHPPSAGS